MPHDYRDPNEFYVTIRSTYRDVVAKHTDDGTDLKTATDEVAELIKPLVKRGDLTVPLDKLIWHAVRDVDRSDGKSADTALRAIAKGQDAVGFDGDPALDLVVKLGKDDDGGQARRKSLRYVTQADLMAMDELRYANLRRQQDAYDRWRKTYEPWFQVLTRHGTVEEAQRSGDLPDFGDDLE